MVSSSFNCYPGAKKTNRASYVVKGGMTRKPHAAGLTSLMCCIDIRLISDKDIR